MRLLNYWMRLCKSEQERDGAASVLEAALSIKCKMQRLVRASALSLIFSGIFGASVDSFRHKSTVQEK